MAYISRSYVYISFGSSSRYKLAYDLELFMPVEIFDKQYNLTMECIGNWNASCSYFYNTYNPIGSSICSNILNYAYSFANASFRTAPSGTKYEYIYQQALLEIPLSVCQSAIPFLSQACNAIADQAVYSKCNEAAFNVTSQLSACTFAAVPNSAENVGAGVLNYAVPLMLTAYLLQNSLSGFTQTAKNVSTILYSERRMYCQ